MYFSEFTLHLIEEVKKKEILFNTSYDKRPKAEKEGAWSEIAEILDSDAEKCKKHWKNVRDRFVKVMHQRDKHFLNGGSELDAPQYVYYDKLEFMRQFSIKKHPPLSVNSTREYTQATDILPDQLLFVMSAKDNEDVITFDYTTEFLAAIKEWPELYDENAELKRYRAKDAWRVIAEKMGGKFTVGKLRSYWINLMKKHKLYLAHHPERSIETESVFESLLFFINNYSGEAAEYAFEDETETSIIKEYVDDDSEEHLVCEVEDEEEDTDEVESIIQDEIQDEDDKAVCSILEEETEEPILKKIKLENQQQLDRSLTCEPTNFSPQFVTPEVVAPQIVAPQVIPQPPSAVTQAPTLKIHTPSTAPPTTSTGEDEFDYFGKKVALQLRDLAAKNRGVARKGEIKVLQLLMELEESVES